MDVAARKSGIVIDNRIDRRRRSTTRSNMTTPTRFTFPSADGVEVVSFEWRPTGSPRGVVQLTHGMGEHVRRYDALAAELTARGFLVVGQDHRGHGETASSDDDLGQIGAAGWTQLVDDVGRLVARTRREYGDRPYVLLGHSMGSFAAQQYALDHSVEITALALTGTAVLDLLEPALDLDAPLDLGMFNAPFAPARTDFDWLTRDDAQVDAYVRDPRCGFGLDGAAGKAMFVAARAMADPRRIAAMREDLPVYIAVGEHDPVNGQLALVNALVERYRAHLTDVTLRVYPGARHEVFNETNRDEVVTDLLSWLDRVVPASS
jgi:alpha-beta hydrolase superfamily lysophospholipase